MKLSEILKIYISLEYSQNEWAYQKIKNDIDDTIGSINEIPMKKRKYFNEVVEVEIEVETYFDVPSSNGKTEKKKFLLNTAVSSVLVKFKFKYKFKLFILNKLNLILIQTI